jgi:hypothetical protein
MWPALALSLGKSILDEQNRKQDLASNVITQKYSPWTGMAADFSSQGENATGKNMLMGIASGLMAQKEATAAAEAAKTAQDKADGDFYASNGDLMRGERGNSIVKQSAFAKAAGQGPLRAPATQVAPSPAPMSAPEQNPWLALTQRPLLPMEAALPDPAPAPRLDPTAGNRTAMWDMFNRITPANAPFKGGGFR